MEAGLDLAMVNPNHITPYGEIAEEDRKLADDLVYNRSEDALEKFIEHFEEKGEEAEAEKANPTEGMEPEEALHFHILRRKRDGVEDQIDAAVEKLGAVPVLNDVLLPAMKEVGDKFGAGELILPFVLQSAEVMKRAVARLENYLDRIEGYTKGTVVLATVFGDVHDIGKSLVNTILTNNGYTVIDLGKQVPIGTIVDAAKEHDATAIGLSALLVSTSKQMPLCVQELHSQSLEYPVLVGGAAINRNFGRRILFPGGTDSEDMYEPGVFYCKDAFEGLAVMDRLVEPERREELVQQVYDEAKTLREKGPEPELGPTDDSSVRSAARTDVPIPTPPFWGAREIEVDLEEVWPHLDLHVLFKLHWGGRGVKGEEWDKLVNEDFRPRLERMWAEQDYLFPKARLGYFPSNADGNDLIVWDPDAPGEKELERFVMPRQPGHDRICLADFYRPLDSGDIDVVAFQAVTAGDEITERMAQLEQDGEFAEQLFVHGMGVQTAEGMAEWMHAMIRHDLGIGASQGRRYSWGYPAVPEQSEHEKLFRLLDAEKIGMRLSGGHARRARAVDGRDRRPSPAGQLLRDEERQAQGRGRPRRGHRRVAEEPRAARPGAAGVASAHRRRRSAATARRPRRLRPLRAPSAATRHPRGAEGRRSGGCSSSAPSTATSAPGGRSSARCCAAGRRPGRRCGSCPRSTRTGRSAARARTPTASTSTGTSHAPGATPDGRSRPTPPARSRPPSPRRGR